MGFDDELLFGKGNLMFEAGARLAINGENEPGRTTLLRGLRSL